MQPGQARTLAAVALAGTLASSCAQGLSASQPRSRRTSTTVAPAAAPDVHLPAPSYLNAPFAPGACIAYPALGPGDGRTVFVDPGHGGADRGAPGSSSPGPGLDEANANLAVGLDLLPLLRRYGYRVVMSRTADTSVAAENAVLSSTSGVHLDTEARVACANTAHADVLVSIHMNGFGDRSIGGAETLYDAARSFALANSRLADLLQSDVLASLRAAGWNVPDRGVLTDRDQGTSTPGAPPGWRHLFVLGPSYPQWNDHPSQMPGALVEPLFVTDPSEDGIVASPVGAQAIARGIAQAIEAFLGPGTPR